MLLRLLAAVDMWTYEWMKIMMYCYHCCFPVNITPQNTSTKQTIYYLINNDSHTTKYRYTEIFKITVEKEKKQKKTIRYIQNKNTHKRTSNTDLIIRIQLKVLYQ